MQYNIKIHIYTCAYNDKVEIKVILMSEFIIVNFLNQNLKYISS